MADSEPTYNVSCSNSDCDNTQAHPVGATTMECEDCGTVTKTMRQIEEGL